MGEIIRVGILTISDRCSKGDRNDESGPAIQSVFGGDAFSVVLYAIVPDERKAISNTLRRWCDEYHCDVLLTTGGTGFSKRDVTPEATYRVIDREAPNISQFLLIEGLKLTPMAALSRAIAGIRGKTLIVNLPGNPSGARESAISLLPLIPHAVDILHERTTEHPNARQLVIDDLVPHDQTSDAHADV